VLFNDFPALKMEDVPVAAVLDAAALEDLMQQVEREREQRERAVRGSAYVSIRQYTSAYVSEQRERAVRGSAYVSIRQHTSAYVSIRQHTSAYVSEQREGAARGSSDAS
jgi:hypothetical protein